MTMFIQTALTIVILVAMGRTIYAIHTLGSKPREHASQQSPSLKLATVLNKIRRQN